MRITRSKKGPAQIGRKYGAHPFGHLDISTGFCKYLLEYVLLGGGNGRFHKPAKNHLDSQQRQPQQLLPSISNQPGLVKECGSGYFYSLSKMHAAIVPEVAAIRRKEVL